MKEAVGYNRLALGGLTAVCLWDNLSGEKASCPNSFFINMQVCVLSCFSHVQLCATPWTVAHQAPLSMGFSRQEYCFSSAQLLSRVRFLRPHEPQHVRPPCPSSTRKVYSNPASRWCHPVIASSVVPFSSCPQILPASGSFQMSQHFP